MTGVKTVPVSGRTTAPGPLAFRAVNPNVHTNKQRPR